MLHELLLAMHGHKGQIFSSEVDKDEYKLQVNPSLPFFHPAELSILNDLLTLASDFSRIQAFIKSHRNAQKSDGLHGLYIEALCEGLDQVLMPYTNSLIQLEQQILEQGNVQLSHIQHKMKPFQPVLASLNNLLKRMKLLKVHSCYILDVIYKASWSGVEKVQSAMAVLLFEGHKVLYKQLLAWILQGSLFDPYAEFFIGEEVSPDVTTEAGTPVEESASTTHTFSTTFSTTFNHGSIHGRRKTYRLKAEMVPGHISVKLAEKIFFIGESIQLFEKDRRIEAQGAVLRERETEIYEKLSSLRDMAEFRVADFERFVDGVRETVSRHLHSLLLERADLKEELGVARSFYFLARGELFHTFIQKADPYLQKPPSATTQHDINQAFQGACRSILQDDEKVTGKVKVVVTPQTGQVGWRCLSLQYTVPWPLHLILTDKSLMNYNQIFQFLLTAKRTQLNLHNVWASQLGDKSHASYSYPSQLRSHMTFVVDNLQQYFMADVLETQFSLLLKKLESSDNFEELRHSHEVFLNAVLAQTFVDNKPVNNCLNELLAVCLQFCRVMDAGQGTSGVVQCLGLTFSRQSGLLFELLTSLRNHHSGSHLAQLLLRIDYNRYFSKHGHDVVTLEQMVERMK